MARLARRWLGLLALLVPSTPLLVAGSAAGSAACEREPEIESLPGIRLGMTPHDIRQRFQPGAEGTWQTNVGAGDDTSLEWRSKDPASRFADVRFEFHLAMLVAARAHLREPTPRESIQATSRTVSVRTPEANGTTALTLLARDCPTHHEEAESLVAKAH